MEIKEILSPNFNTGRGGKYITRITPHCIVGQVSAETCASWFADPKRQASANYIIGKDGEIVRNVKEENRAWTSSNRDNDERAITIECASDNRAPYAFNEKVFQSLIDLTVDIMKRYNKTELVWIPVREEALSVKISDHQLLITLHRWFAAKECPGQWLIDHMQEYVNSVNQVFNKKEECNKTYYVQVGAFHNKENAERLADMIKADGYEVYIKEE